MRKLNNKGFAIAGVLYTLLIIFLALIFSFLLMLNNRKTILDQIKKDVYNDLSGIVGNSSGATIKYEANKTYKAIVYLDPTDLNKTCTESNSISTTGTKTGCMKWYVYEEDDDTYTMILDHNTTDKVAWNSNDSVNNTDIKLKEDTANWNTILNTRLITVDEIAHIVGADREDTIKWNSSKGNGTDDIETKVSWFYFDGSGTSYSTTDGWQKPVATSKGESRYAWLFDYTNECIMYGCDIEDSSNAGYWTSTTPNRESASNWMVNRHGYIMFSLDSATSYGIRPVITVDKSIFDDMLIYFGNIPNEIIIGDSYDLSNNDISCNVANTPILNTSSLDIGEHIINCTVKTLSGNNETVSKNISVRQALAYLTLIQVQGSNFATINGNSVSLSSGTGTYDFKFERDGYTFDYTVGPSNTLKTSEGVTIISVPPGPAVSGSYTMTSGYFKSISGGSSVISINNIKYKGHNVNIILDISSVITPIYELATGTAFNEDNGYITWTNKVSLDEGTTTVNLSDKPSILLQVTGPTSTYSQVSINDGEWTSLPNRGPGYKYYVFEKAGTYKLKFRTQISDLYSPIAERTVIVK